MVTTTTTTRKPATKHKRRYCRFEGCGRIVKSQGLCQRHGARPRSCSVEGCIKQAQGNFNGMCKAHYRESTQQGSSVAKKPSTPSVVASALHEAGSAHGLTRQEANSPATASPSPSLYCDHEPPQVAPFPSGTVYAQTIPASIGPEDGRPMPLLTHLQRGLSTKPAGWHRNEERTARSLQHAPIDRPLEDWEVELLFVQTLILSGTSQGSFQCLAHAWGQREGFHRTLGNIVCASNQQAHEISSENESSSGSPSETDYQGYLGMSAVDRTPVPAAAAASSTPSLPQAMPVASSHGFHIQDDTSSRRKRSPLDTLIAALSTHFGEQ